ncbi:HAD-IB family phosphatase [Urbifossiella limnaea]|uniref:2-hydroxy-3-keto-5-methylthiopentenyl-1-phosphate phosphatase n=1 Tax=Urbifossiella limnaea TaxID=2528023 RepID=A0A517XWV8_9BACT|nr:HAD-IB family phosphatase [Urbifossiella limnaea]QDU21989.1 2-hydroxy-3-keto-5-methylthiopentenyl-1-phosphate phosphatase [Urbifossiella limnaea]
MTRVLVSDFDGTMTRHDFYKLALADLLPPDVPDQWAAYRAGEITHFEALRRYFAAIRAPEAEVLAVVDRMELDPGLKAAVTTLAEAGWVVVVTSAGCGWYIGRLLAAAEVSVEVHANPGRFEAGAGVLMEKPVGSPYYCENLGVDKARVVRDHLAAGRTVAFAGDGFPDSEAARLVPDGLRFARADLADVLTREGLPFHPFEVWSDIARVLVPRGG